MKLYSFPGSCGLAAHITLGWIGKPFDVDLVKKENLKTPEYLKINPMGKVPVLDDGGFILSENAAVLTYLAGKFPDAKLEGDGSLKGKAIVHHWLGLVNSEIHPAYKPLFGATAYLGDDKAIEKSKDNARKQLRHIFEIVNTQLGKTNYIAGTRSIADAYLFVTVMWAGIVKIDLSGLDHIKAFEQRMRADPAVKAALKGEGLEK